MLATPRSYGWPWDVAVVTGFGYGDLDLETAQSLLEDDPNVESWTVMGFLNEVSLAGEPMMTALTLERLSNVDLPVVQRQPSGREGRDRAGRDDGRQPRPVSRRLGRDRWRVRARDRARSPASSCSPAWARVWPTVCGTGTGLLIPQALFDHEDLRALAPDAVGLATFLGVDLQEGTELCGGRGPTGPSRSARPARVPGLELPAPVRPPEIVDAGSTKQLPRLVGLVFAAAAGLGLGFASWAALGAGGMTSVCSGPWVSRAPRSGGLSTSSPWRPCSRALAVGIPLGLMTGRLFWIEFAGLLGVVDAPASATTLVVLTIGGGLLLAAFAALLPAHTAADAPLATALRAE